MKRADLARQFSMSSSTPLKTFVVEAHSGGEPRAFLDDLAGGSAARRVHDTDDVYLHELVCAPLHFYVDHLDERFWSFHTQSASGDAFRFLRERVESRRDLDWAWLPSSHLRHVWRGSTPHWLRSDFRAGRLLPDERVQDLQVEVRGRDADALVDHIRAREGYAGAIAFDRVAVTASDLNYGVVREGVNRRGRFVATGESFELHQVVVRGVVRRYRRLIEAIESRGLAWAEFPEGGGAMVGAPIAIEFSQPISDMGLFLDELLSSRDPFRLWGLTEELGEDTVGVEAVDLHVGQALRLDITPHWVRIYLSAGACGNTVARLATNLQHRFDGALRLVASDLEDALNVRAAGR